MELALAFIVGMIIACLLFLGMAWWLDRKYGPVGKDD